MSQNKLNFLEASIVLSRYFFTILIVNFEYRPSLESSVSSAILALRKFRTYRGYPAALKARSGSTLAAAGMQTSASSRRTLWRTNNG